MISKNSLTLSSELLRLKQDVTSFYLMILYRLAVMAQNHAARRLVQDVSFEMARCIATLKELLQNENVQLPQRLEGALASAHLASDAIQLGRRLVSRRALQ